MFGAGWRGRHSRGDLKRVRLAAVVLGLLVPAMALLWVLSDLQDAPGAGQSAVIPVGSRYAEGDQVEVLYAADEPGTARTAQDWAPLSQPAALLYVAAPASVLLFALWRLRSQRRSQRRSQQPDGAGAGPLPAT